MTDSPTMIACSSEPSACKDSVRPYFAAPSNSVPVGLLFVCCACREGATPLLLPYSAEDHATIAAAAGAAALNSPSDSSSSSSSGRSWFGSSKKHQEDQQRQQELQAQQRQQQQQLQKQLQEQKQQELYTAAIAVDASELRLNQANHFMPPDSVLELSGFSLPRDPETLDFYNWLLS